MTGGVRRRTSATTKQEGSKHQTPDNNVTSNGNTARHRNRTITTAVDNKTKLLHEQIGAGLDFPDAAARGSVSSYDYDYYSSHLLLDSYRTPTSFSLIVLLHVIFIYHWLFRKSRRDLLVSYRVIVQKRQYHKVWLAMLSHPPAKHSNIGHNPRHRSGNGGFAASLSASGSFEDGEHDRNNNNSNNTGGSDQDLRNRLQEKAIQYALWAYQSGFALMLYNSHILWSCRALEVHYNTVSSSEYYKNMYYYTGASQPSHPSENNNSNNNKQDQATGPIIRVHPLQYLRVLFSLTFMALVLELRVSSLLLKIAARGSLSSSGSDTDLTIRFTDNTTGNSNRQRGRQSSESGSTTDRIQHRLLYRSIGTLTSLSCALLIVFQHRFEYVPLQVFPFLDNRWLLVGLSLPAFITPFLCLFILAILSMPSHPVTSVCYGLFSGILWSFGLISFLEEPYWGNSLILAIILVSCASIKATGYSSTSSSIAPPTTSTTRGGFTNASNPNTPAAWVPCIDFVSWNRRGERMRTFEERERSASSSNVTASEEEDETVPSTDDDDSSSGGVGSSSFREDDLYGRLPDLSENLEDEDIPAAANNESANNTRNRTMMRSRRGTSSVSD